MALKTYAGERVNFGSELLAAPQRSKVPITAGSQGCRVPTSGRSVINSPRLHKRVVYGGVSFASHAEEQVSARCTCSQTSKCRKIRRVSERLWSHQQSGVGKFRSAQKASSSVQCCVSELATVQQTPSLQLDQPVIRATEQDSLSEAVSLSSEEQSGPSAAGRAGSQAVPTKVVRTLLIDNYDSYTYNLYQMLAVVNGAAPVIIFNDQMSWEELKPLLVGPSRAFDNVVISPGPGTPARQQDTGICARIFEECPALPVLGVCLGHQLLGHVHGATVTHAPEPVHGQLSDLVHTGHPLFDGIPSGPDAGFKVVRYHSLVVDPATLSPHLVPTAWTVPGAHPCTNTQTTANNVAERSLLPDSSPLLSIVNDNCGGRPSGSFEESAAAGVPEGAILMALSHRSLPHHGVQFHPESIATAYGERLLQNFYSMTVDYWERPSPASNGHQGKLVNGQHVERFRSLSNASELLSSWSIAQQSSPSQGQRSQSLESSVSAPATDGHVRRQEGASRVLDLSERLATESGASDSHREAEKGSYRVVWKRLTGVLQQERTPEALFMALYGRTGGEDAFWLDSSSTAAGRGRFSFMGGKGGPLWRKVTYFLGATAGPTAGRLVLEDSQGEIEERTTSSIFDYLEEELRLRQCPRSDWAELPFDFCGGFVGYLGYELKRECGVRVNKHTSTQPDAAFFLADRIVVVDHTEGDVYLVEMVGSEDRTAAASVSNLGAESSRDVSQAAANGRSTIPAGSNNTHDDGRGGTSQNHLVSTEWIEQTANIVLQKGNSQNGESSEEITRSKQDRQQVTQQAKVNRSSIPDRVKPSARDADDSAEAQYIEDVRKCMEEIRNGETYEVCLTTRLHPEAFIPRPLALYQHLRHVNPAPYSAWLSFGGAGPSTICCSPERFLKLDRHGMLEAKPIKGTCPRGADVEKDVRLPEQLRTSPKDRAENLMIVDLLRNDLGKVCQVGSVHVPSLMAIESFATVHQLVSTVRGLKRPEVGPLACVRASFPAGSMTGAPKLRTMEIIDAIEGSARGVYSGALGFFSVNGTFDLNVVIRTATWHEGRVSIGAGGAVVALSDAEAEYAEMLLKAQALLAAVAEHSAE